MANCILGISDIWHTVHVGHDVLHGGYVCWREDARGHVLRGTWSFLGELNTPYILYSSTGNCQHSSMKLRAVVC